MGKIHKGMLELVNNETTQIKLGYEDDFYDIKLDEVCKNIPDDDKNNLLNYLWRHKFKLIQDNEIIYLLNKNFKKINYDENEKKDKQAINILYEIVVKDDILYGKELYTGLIFPIFKAGNGIHLEYSIDSYLDIIEDSYCTTTTFTDYYLTRKHKVNIPNLEKCGCMISYMKVADNNEIKAYMSKFQNVINRYLGNELFKKKIMTYYNKNIYRDNSISEDQYAIQKSDEVNSFTLTKKRK